jgi:hypothetical protein
MGTIDNDERKSYTDQERQSRLDSLEWALTFMRNYERKKNIRRSDV